MTTAYLALGSNLGDKKRNISEAIKHIGELAGMVVGQSDLYETAPCGFVSIHDFINAAVCVDTELTPRQLLAATQRIERMMGRTEKSSDGEYHDRVIDIDILLYGTETVDEPDLKIPHPEMWKRSFVMRPLLDITRRETFKAYADEYLEYMGKVPDEKTGRKRWE